MKIMYRVNQIVLIINLILVIIPPIGLLFMIPLGVIQVVSSLWLLTQYKQTSKSIKWMNSIHLLLTVLVLGTMYFIAEDYSNLSYSHKEMIFIMGMFISGLLGVFFVYVSYTNYNEFEEKQLLTQEPDLYV